MKYVVLAALALALQLVLFLPVQAAGTRINAFERVFGPIHCSAKGVCVVKGSPGGVIDDFEAAAHAINQSHVRVVIAGPCYSACALFADKARAHVCITANAEFGFHQASISYVSADGRILGIGPDTENPLPGDSKDIDAWVRAHGGYPPPNDLLIMNFAEAHKFWKSCSLAHG